MSVYRQIGQIELTKEEGLRMFADKYAAEMQAHEQPVEAIKMEDVRLKIELDGRIVITHDPEWEDQA